MKYAFIVLAVISNILALYHASRGYSHLLYALWFVICTVFGWGAAAFLDLEKMLKDLYKQNEQQKEETP